MHTNILIVDLDCRLFFFEHYQDGVLDLIFKKIY